MNNIETGFEFSFTLLMSGEVHAGTLIVDITGDLVATSDFIAREVTSHPTPVGKRFWRVRKIE